jgi:N-acetylmuramoyl-L-alanine amidase
VKNFLVKLWFWIGVLGFVAWVTVFVLMMISVTKAEAVSTWRNSSLIKLQRYDIDIMARTIYGEARGEDLPGMVAVGWVILNRAKRGPPRFPSSIAAVCKQNHQFTCWSKSDPNSKVCAAASESDPYFALAVFAASGVLTGNIPDTTRGSDHYHTVGMVPYPIWASKMQLQAIVGQHRFYIERPVK